MQSVLHRRIAIQNLQTWLRNRKLLALWGQAGLPYQLMLASVQRTQQLLSLPPMNQESYKGGTRLRLQSSTMSTTESTGIMYCLHPRDQHSMVSKDRASLQKFLRKNVSAQASVITQTSSPNNKLKRLFKPNRVLPWFPDQSLTAFRNP